MSREGKIYEHLVDNVVLRDPPMGISPLWTNLQRIFSPQPVPCPGVTVVKGKTSRAWLVVDRHQHLTL